jgi:ribosome maturation factor RimP
MGDKSFKADSRLRQLDELVDRVLAGSDLYRVETRIKGSYRQPMVDVFIDGDDGVTIDQCAEVSRLLHAAIELDELFEKSFKLDVSSPGLGKPLMLPRQYRRHVGRNLEVRFKESASDDDESHPKSVAGTLVAAESSGITLAIDKDQLSLRFEDIERAVVTPTF